MPDRAAVVANEEARCKALEAVIRLPCAMLAQPDGASAPRCRAVVMPRRGVDPKLSAELGLTEFSMEYLFRGD